MHAGDRQADTNNYFVANFFNFVREKHMLQVLTFFTTKSDMYGCIQMRLSNREYS